MLLSRLVTVALCTTCFAMLVSLERLRFAADAGAACRARAAMTQVANAATDATTRGPLGRRPVRVAAALPADPPVSVVDVADGVAASQIPGMLRLGPGEYISAVNDRDVYGDAEVSEWIAALPRRPGSFVDLTIDSRRGERRVLVLLH